MDKARIKKLLPVAILAGGLLLFIVILISRPTPNIKTPDEPAWPVHALTLKKGTYTPYVELYGRVESPEMAEKKARIEADVAKVYVREGVKVDQNQPLLQLDDRELKLLWQQRKADVDDFKAQIEAEMVRYDTDKKSLEHEKKLVAIAEKNVGRREHLIKTLAGSELALDDAREELRTRHLTLEQRQQAISDHKNRLAQLQAKLLKAEALLGLTNIEIEKTTVKAPFKGRVTQVMVSTGDRVKPGDILIQIYDSRWTEVRCQIPEKYIIPAREALAEGKKIVATTKINNKSYELVLTRLAGRAEKGRLGIDALFRFTQPITEAVMGRTVTMHINLPPMKDVFAVPITALYGGNRVYKIKKDRLQGVTVTKLGVTDIKDQQYFLINSPQLAVGEKIITTQLPNAITGLKVKIMPQDKPV